MTAGGRDKEDEGALDATLQATPAERAAAEGRRLAKGRLVGGRYEVLRFIAGGGMGEVYEVHDRLVGERVALKTIRAGQAERGRTVERFRREIQLARQVTHPNVVRIFDVGEEEELLFFTMELLAGENLSARVARGRLSAGEALPLARQMAAALDAAHQAGIVHRDFKPQNVVLVEGRGTTPMRVVVTDFGVARTMDEDVATAALTGAGDFIGTPLYMAPEQVAGRIVTAAADVYALGVTLYEMVTGVAPFGGPTQLAIASARLTETPRPPVELVPELPPSWNRTIMACLERNPTRRPSSAGAVVALLDASTGRRPRPRLLAAIGVIVAAVAAVLVARALGGRSDSRVPKKAPAASGPAVDPEAKARAREHFLRGNQLFAQERYDEALDEHMQSYEISPNPNVLLNLGSAYRARGDTRTAVFFYRRYLRDAPASTKRAEVEEMIRELTAAAPDAGAPDAGPAAIVLPPDIQGEMEARFEEARAAYDRGDYQLAAEKFLSVYGGGRWPELLFNVAASYQLAKDHGKAAHYFRRYLQEAPNPKDRAGIEARIRVLEAARDKQ